MSQEGWGWWSVFQQLDQYEVELAALVPNPSNTNLIELNREYTPTELQDLLQKYGSYLSTIHYIEGKLEAQCHAIKESFKTGVSVAMAESELSATSVTGKEAEVVAGSEIFRETRKLQIANESQLLLLKGWRESYETAWNTISRIITLRMGEAGLSTGRHP